MRHPVILGFAVLTLAYPSLGGADSLPLTATACGPASSWLCYATGTQTLTTTFDAPAVEWSVTPLHPVDLENWRLINVEVAFGGSAAFALVYPGPGPSGAAYLSDATFHDSLGRVLLATGRGLDASCFTGVVGPYAGKWVCADGNSMARYASFGEIGGSLPVDPILPSLDGAITIRLGWFVSTSEPPELSELNVSGVSFSYIYAPIPEPSVTLLVGAGVGILSALRRRGPARAL